MQVNIRYVNFPKPGGKYGSLTTTDNQRIWVPPDLLGMFRAGMTAEIGTKQQTWGQGNDARTVTIATSGPLQGQTAGYQGNQYAQGQNPQPRPYAAGRPNTGFQPRVVQGGGRPDHDAKMIFVTGVVGRAMGSGKFTASEIAVLAQAAAQAFDVVTRPPPPPQPEPQPEPQPGLPPDDEPPFPEGA
jgi:hypothetical protein